MKVIKKIVAGLCILFCLFAIGIFVYTTIAYGTTSADVRTPKNLEQVVIKSVTSVDNILLVTNDEKEITAKLGGLVDKNSKQDDRKLIEKIINSRSTLWLEKDTLYPGNDTIWLEYPSSVVSDTEYTQKSLNGALASKDTNYFNLKQEPYKYSYYIYNSYHHLEGKDAGNITDSSSTKSPSSATKTRSVTK